MMLQAFSAWSAEDQDGSMRPARLGADL